MQKLEYMNANSTANSASMLQGYDSRKFHFLHRGSIALAYVDPIFSILKVTIFPKRE